MNAPNASFAERAVARAVRSLLCGIVAYWAVAVVLVRTAAGVPDWWLPVALALGWLVPPPALALASPRPSPAWRWTLAAVIAAAIAAVAYGALATPSRHWDGAVALDAKAYWLTAAPTLVQPYFADPAVFHHSPDFPLLLPLLTASTERLLGGGLGRLWLPLIYGLLLASVATAAWRAGWSRRLASLLVVAVAVAPELLGPGGGAADSGYADVLLLLATTVLAGGLLLASPLDVGLGVVLAIASKPEGPVYADLAALAAFVVGHRRSFVVAVGATVAAFWWWAPTARQLLHEPPVSMSYDIGYAAGVLGAGAVTVVLGTIALSVAQRTRRPERWRVGFAVCAALAGFGSLPLLAQLFPPDSAAGVYLHRGAAWHDGLRNLGAWAVAWAHFSVLRVGFGLTFVVALLLALSRRRGDAATPVPVFLATGLLATALPFVLTPEADVQHHLRASLPRLMLHWLGAAWLFIGGRLDAMLAREPAGAAAPAAAS